MKRITELEINHNQKEIIWLLESTNRKGMKDVIEFLSKNNFFTLTPTITRHHKYSGGLAQHSLGVFHQALKLDHNQNEESLIIVCILHDICKIDNVFPEFHGHGRRSLNILKAIGLDLNSEEETAIQCHMHHDENSNVSLQAIVHTADRRDVSAFRNNFD